MARIPVAEVRAYFEQQPRLTAALRGVLRGVAIEAQRRVAHLLGRRARRVAHRMIGEHDDLPERRRRVPRAGDDDLVRERIPAERRDLPGARRAVEVERARLACGTTSRPDRRDIAVLDGGAVSPSLRTKSEGQPQPTAQDRQLAALGTLAAGAASAA